MPPKKAPPSSTPTKKKPKPLIKANLQKPPTGRVMHRLVRKKRLQADADYQEAPGYFTNQYASRINALTNEISAITTMDYGTKRTKGYKGYKGAKLEEYRGKLAKQREKLKNERDSKIKMFKDEAKFWASWDDVNYDPPGPPDFGGPPPPPPGAGGMGGGIAV